MKEERIQGAACLAAAAILGEARAPEGWRKVPVWIDIAESYVEAYTWDERKKFELVLSSQIENVRKIYEKDSSLSA